eukprot:TRINITY_DN3755_c0_g1_i1.p1 TRINITY_DN3755_c0_g1~~TRINITY_DN3755_c0_g1_i1.p1  ORF type:complete len:831 (-),score=261.39 TRINITY_DN3755_c0_g1_i1:283-2775(-)
MAGAVNPIPELLPLKNVSLFDFFYEEFLHHLVKTNTPASASSEDEWVFPKNISDEFMSKSTDIERVDYLLKVSSFLQDFQITRKCGLKSKEKSDKLREEGNKLFQNDQSMQAILYYNKAISLAPHPCLEEASNPRETALGGGGERGGKATKVKFSDEGRIRAPGKYESLSLCYANRSAALRKLCQYEDCLKDIARAARFGYPRENLYKLWERKGKCYQGLKKFELASKCIRQSLSCLKESSLTDTQKHAKAQELQALLKEWRNTHFVMQMGENVPLPSVTSSEDATKEEVLMGATGPLVFVPEEAKKKDKKKEPSKPDRSLSLRIKSDKTRDKKMSVPLTPPGTSSGSNNNNGLDLARPLEKTTSQLSISNLSASVTNTKPDVEVPELSYGANPRMPSASLVIDLRFSPDKGRYFVANQDLTPGDVILREEPYAAVLESVFRSNHCAHCLKKTPTPIPCCECSTVQYCGETCRDLSWNEYHKIECGILTYLEPSRFLGKMPHLALRIVTKTGMQNLIQHSISAIIPIVKDQQGAGSSNSPGTGQQQQSSHFDPTSYRSVHNLATNADKRTFEDLTKKTAQAIFTAKCLSFNGFFGDGTQEEVHRAEVFISSLLLRHLQIASTNGLEMAECILKNNDVTKFDIIPVGGAIFPTMSFFNHSCYPNCLRLGYQSYQVVRVVRPILRGEEINIDYGFDFYANPIEKRQGRANSQYYFQCTCVACVNNWPNYNQLMAKPREYKCKVTPDILTEINRQTATYAEGMDYLVRLDIVRALPLLREYLLVVGQLVAHPDPQFIDCEEAYKQCLWLEGRHFRPNRVNHPPVPLLFNSSRI